jgi:hypothetical protein
MAFNMPSFGMMLVRLSHWKHTKRKRVGTFKELSHFPNDGILKAISFF